LTRLKAFKLLAAYWIVGADIAGGGGGKVDEELEELEGGREPGGLARWREGAV
jgi:hypothetical protein